MADYQSEAEAPLDPAAERLRRKLVRLLLGSGLLMMLGLIAVFAAIVYKTGLLGGAGGPVAAGIRAGATSGRQPVEAAVEIPAGARLIAADLDGGSVLLTIETGQGATLILVDLASGEVLGRYAVRER